MPYARSAIPDFALANPLYIGATVSFFTVDLNGDKTATLAPLYANTIGIALLPNPQILDSFGKFAVPVYIQDPVIATIEPADALVLAHDTGIIANGGRRRSAYSAAVLYYANDLIQDSGTGIVYAAAQTFLSTNLTADIVAGNLAVFLTPPDLNAAINAAAQAAAAAASALAAAASDASAASSNTSAAASATASAASATTSAGSATTATTQAGNASTSATAAAASAATAAAAVASQIAPQGRLSLSGVPVLATDVVAATTINYLPYRGRNVPVYDGANFGALLLGAGGISLALDSNSGHAGYHVAGSLFDIFVFDGGGGTPLLGTGPAWTGITARGTGAGTTEIERKNAIWVNKNAINLRIDASNPPTAVAVNKATYLGTFQADGDGNTSMVFNPNAAAGGSGNKLQLYNAYNRVRVLSQECDSTANWTYATATWRSTNGNAANSVLWVDGLQESFVQADYSQKIGSAAEGSIGVGLDSNTAAPNKVATLASNINGHIHAIASFAPQIGAHIAYAMEFSVSGTTTYYGDPYMSLRVGLEM